MRPKHPLCKTVIDDPTQCAKMAGLCYVTDAMPGIRRIKYRKGFRYLDPQGCVIRDAKTLDRIKSLVIPPAWAEVWICPKPKGHLQVTGRDAKGRKQSRYHPLWREVRDETKYERMILFGSALPSIRKQVENDISLPGLPRRKILGTIIRLMETTFIRVGNEEYARKNRSYGLTTMRNKHVAIDGSTVTFSFKGKSGVAHTVGITDRRIATIVRRCHDIPGYELFQYIDEEGTQHSIDSSDVNDYLREISGQDYTAKDFRTWAGTLLSSGMLSDFAPFESEAEARKNIVQTIKYVASRLGNTPAVCKKCYVHPTVLHTYETGGLPRRAVIARSHSASYEMLREEQALLKLLRA
jgi:DNA topoisomerase I